MKKFDAKEALSKLTSIKSKAYVKASIERYKKALIDLIDLQELVKDSLEDCLRPSIDLCDEILGEIKDI